MPEKLSRRQAITACLATYASLSGGPRPLVDDSGWTMHSPYSNAIAEQPNSSWPPKKNSVCVFTKPFNSLSFDQLADQVAELGVDGIEAPIRRGGHVAPRNIADELPKLVEALAKRDLEITILASDINDPTDPMTANTLQTAADLGIRRYRMKYFKYDLSKPVVEQLDHWKSVLRDLAAMNRDIGIQGIYQNHAGKNTFGAPIWDLQYALNGINVEEIGVAYDIRHATVEGGQSWPISFNLIRPHIDTVYVKDFAWEGKKVKNVPLGSGLIDPKFFAMLAKSNFSGPISLHQEYLDHNQPSLVPDHLAAFKNDVNQLHSWLED